MKTMSKVLLVLILAFGAVSCRSIPQDVADAHAVVMTESDEAMGLAEDTLGKIAAKSAELNDETVTAAWEDWNKHLALVLEARRVVDKYLKDSKAGDDVTGPYAVGHQLLADMHGGFATINKYWEDMISDNPQGGDVNAFIAAFRKDIARYKELMRKFDEWISQFRVKG